MSENNYYNRMVSLGIEPYNLQKPIYKYRTLKSAIDILTSSQLYFPSAEELLPYDKLEVHPSIIDLSFSPVLKYNYLKNLFERNNIKDIAISSVSDEEFRGMMSQNLKFCKTKIGIFSCGKSNNNCFLWERYGDKHKGVCLGFVIPKNTIASKLCFNVLYTNQPQKISFFDADEAELTKDIFYWFSVKKSWYSNEEEVRIIDETATGQRQFNRGMMFEVILGADTTYKDYQLIRDTLYHNGYSARIGKIKVEDDKFDLQISYYP